MTNQACLKAAGTFGRSTNSQRLQILQDYFLFNFLYFYLVLGFMLFTASHQQHAECN
jgi:hypothetical protein